MTIQKFIEKWNVAYESKEQALEFAAEMRDDLKRYALIWYLKGAYDADTTSNTEHIRKDFETHFQLVFNG